MTKPAAATNAIGLSDEQRAIGKALRALEPEVMDLALMARLVANYAQEWLSNPAGASFSAEDAETLLFGIYQVSGRARDIRKGYAVALGRRADD